MKTLSVTDGQTDWPMDRAGHSCMHATKNAKFWKHSKLNIEKISKLNFENIGLWQANEIFHVGTYWGQVQACKILW